MIEEELRCIESLSTERDRPLLIPSFVFHANVYHLVKGNDMYYSR